MKYYKLYFSKIKGQNIWPEPDLSNEFGHDEHEDRPPQIFALDVLVSY